MSRNLKLPNAKKYKPDPAYITTLVEQCKANSGLSSQAAVAERIGVGRSTLKDWMSGVASPGYPGQYILEALAAPRQTRRTVESPSCD